MMGESELVDVEGSNRAMSVLCRMCPSELSNGGDDSAVESHGDVAGLGCREKSSGLLGPAEGSLQDVQVRGGHPRGP